MVNLGFTSEAASQIINFYKIIAKVNIYKRVKLVFVFKLSTKWLHQTTKCLHRFCKFSFTCLLHDLTSYTEKH